MVDVIIFVLALALAACINALFSLGICYVAESFGHPLPFWPVMVGLFIVMAIIRSVSGAERHS